MRLAMKTLVFVPRGRRNGDISFSSVTIAGVKASMKIQLKAPSRPSRSFSALRDDDEDDIEADIARQASKNKALSEIEQQHKKALEQDPSIFDYDGVYDEMKVQSIRPIVQDREERKSKYIEKLVAKAKEREREHEIIYERKLAKERSKDEHLYRDKEKFLTGAYKRKLTEQAQWLKEERLQQLREAKEDVTKKEDLTDFYFNLSKNVAFGGKTADSREALKHEVVADACDEARLKAIKSVSYPCPDNASLRKEKDYHEKVETATSSANAVLNIALTSISDPSEKCQPVGETVSVATQPAHSGHRLSEDALAAARERYLARKKGKLLAGQII